MQLLEAGDLLLCEGLVHEVGERRAPPEAEGGAQLCRRSLGLAGCERGPATGERALEAVAVELVRRQLERIRPADRAQGLGASGQFLPQGRDAVLQDLGRRGGRALAPERVDDDVPGQGLVRPQQQQGQDGALPRAAKRKPAFAVERLEWPEDAVVHRGSA